VLDSPLTPYECFRLWECVNQWYRKPLGGPHEFEDKISEVLISMGFTTFVRRRVHGKSCTDHEYDIISRKKTENIFLFSECKTGTGCLGKDAVLSFYAKVFDVFNLAKKVLEIRRNGFVNKYYFEDVYCVLVSSIPLEKPALVCALAFGILVVQPYCKFEDYISLPPSHADYYRLEKSGKKVAEQFKDDLKKICMLTFRGLLSNGGRVFNGEYLYSKMESYHKVINSLIK
jgi:hypothetical protein